MTAARQNLILVGGIFHDFHTSAEALAAVLAPLGIASRIEADLDAGIEVGLNARRNAQRRQYGRKCFG